MIEKHVKQKILEKAILLDKFGINDLTWEKEDAKNLITSLMQDNIGILGGSVYKLDLSHLVPMYDNWSCNPNKEETRNEFCLRSKIESLDYINKYPVYPQEKILFSIVFTEDVN